MSIPVFCALVLLAYLLGSIPFGLLLGRLRGVDIRKVGSGNIGATNLTRSLGRRWGIAAFMLDFIKGGLPVLTAAWVGFDEPPAGGIHYQYGQIACALAAVLGHVFPLYLRFRGGKGVATTFGAMAALVWISALAAGTVWLVLFLVTRTVSIASLAAAFVFPATTIVLFYNAPPSIALPMDLLALSLGLMILVRHRSNIKRLLKREESRF